MHAPGCESKEVSRLLFLHKSGEPPGDPNHQIGYAHDLVEICPSCNGATLERLRHDCFDFEDVWDQYEWYELSPEDGSRLREVAARCAEPLNPSCRCAVHASLRESATALPVSSWDAAFESAAHRHSIRLSAVGTPRFTLVKTGVATKPAVPPDPTAPKPADKQAVLFIVVAWPITFVMGLLLWFRALDVHWFFDAVFTVGWFGLSFVVAGVVLALGSVIAKRR